MGVKGGVQDSPLGAFFTGLMYMASWLSITLASPFHSSS